YSPASSSSGMSFFPATISAAASASSDSPSESPSSCVFAGRSSTAYTTMNATAHADESPSSRSMERSARASVSRFGMILGASLRGGRFRPTRSTSAATSQSFALATAQPLPKQHAERDEHAHAEEPRHETLRNRPDVTERPAAAVVGALRPFDVSDDRVKLAVRDRLRREGRHHVGTDPDCLSDLHGRGAV